MLLFSFLYEYGPLNLPIFKKKKKEITHGLVMSKEILMVSVCTSKREDTFILHPSLTTNLKPDSGIVPQLTANAP